VLSIEFINLNNKGINMTNSNKIKKSLYDKPITSWKVDNVFYISKFEKMKDLRQFAAELEEEWIEYKHQQIDCDNAWYEDDIMIEFFQDGAESAGLEGWESDYLFWTLGY
jgi:hypothetical protein